MKRKPTFFNKEVIIDGYTFYQSNSDQHDRVYVPRTKDDFHEFIDRLWYLTSKKNKTPKAKKNYEMIKRYPWLFVKNRWDGGIYLYNKWDSNKKDKFDTWFDINEGDLFIILDEELFLKFQEELREEFLNNNPELLYEYTVVDTKEKYGTFRWYDNGNTENGHRIVNKYMDLYDAKI